MAQRFLGDAVHRGSFSGPNFDAVAGLALFATPGAANAIARGVAARLMFTISMTTGPHCHCVGEQVEAAVAALPASLATERSLVSTFSRNCITFPSQRRLTRWHRYSSWPNGRTLPGPQNR